jgi:hypothetical protein
MLLLLLLLLLHYYPSATVTACRYTATCRIILICNSSSKIIAPVRSRCLGIRVPAPAHEDVCAALTVSLPRSSFFSPSPPSPLS